MNRRLVVYGVITLLVIGVVLLFVDEPLDEDTKSWLVAEPFSEADRETIRLYKKFSETPQYRDPGRKLNPKQRSASRLCYHLTQPCATIISTDKQRVEPLVPDNPAYWSAYRAAVEAGAPRLDPEMEISESPFPTGTELITASSRIYLRELLDHGVIDPEIFFDHLELSRRLLTKSDLLIGKLIFLAVFGIHVSAVNTMLSIDSSEVASLANDQRLDKLLQPLTTEEQSFRNSLKTEFQFGYRKIENDSRDDLYEKHGLLKGNAFTNKYFRIFSHLADRSEMGWGSYWSSPVNHYEFSVFERVFDPLGVKNLMWITQAYHSYTGNAQLIQALLATARLRRDIVKKGLLKNVEFPSMPFWRWEKSELDEEVCLVPDKVHPDHETDKFWFCSALKPQPRTEVAIENLDAYITSAVCEEKRRNERKEANSLEKTC